MKYDFCESQLIKIIRHCVFMNTSLSSVLKDNKVWKYIMITLSWKLQDFSFFQSLSYSGKQDMQLHWTVRNICLLSWRAYNVITDITNLYRWEIAFPTYFSSIRDTQRLISSEILRDKLRRSLKLMMNSNLRKTNWKKKKKKQLPVSDCQNTPFLLCPL